MRDTGIDNNTEILDNRAAGDRMKGGEFRHAKYIGMGVPFIAGDRYSTTHDSFSSRRWQIAA